MWYPSGPANKHLATSDGSARHYRVRMDVPARRVDMVRLPFGQRAPLTAVLSRIAFAVGLLVFIAIVVFVGRGGYDDTAGGEIGIIDALYYASVTVTTTGYGDIAAVTPATRTAALLLITPARILFLILVVGTTVEVLTERSRQLILTKRWRRNVHDHYIICGFGSTGISAARALRAQGIDPESIVVVDPASAACARANEEGLTSVCGDATRVAVLDQAGVRDSRSVIVTPNRDDTAVLVTLTAREMNPGVHIVAAGRVQENLHLLRQSGADAVIDSSNAVGRLLGIATQTPTALDVIDDLLDVGTALELAEVAPVRSGEAWAAPGGSVVVEVRRSGRRMFFDAPDLGALRRDDELLVMRTRPH